MIEQAANSYESFKESFKIQNRNKKLKFKIRDSMYSFDHTFENLYLSATKMFQFKNILTRSYVQINVVYFLFNDNLLKFET